MEINKDIIRKVQNHDRSACKLIYEMYSRPCLGICLRYARKRVDAEDMLQEGFLEVFRNINTYAFNGSFEGWVKKVIVHQVFNYIRKHYKFQEDVDGVELIETTVHNNQSMEEMELLAIINSIPEKYKISFNLHAIEKYSHKEIGELLSIEESTSRSQFLRARNMIKKKLEDIQNFENKISKYGT